MYVLLKVLYRWDCSGSCTIYLFPDDVNSWVYVSFRDANINMSSTGLSSLVGKMEHWFCFFAILCMVMIHYSTSKLNYEAPSWLA